MPSPTPIWTSTLSVEIGSGVTLGLDGNLTLDPDVEIGNITPDSANPRGGSDSEDHRVVGRHPCTGGNSVIGPPPQFAQINGYCGYTNTSGT